MAVSQRADLDETFTFASDAAGLHLAGSLDRTGLDDLRDALDDVAQHDRVVLDLEGVTRLPSSAVQALHARESRRGRPGPGPGPLRAGRYDGPARAGAGPAALRAHAQRVTKSAGSISAQRCWYSATSPGQLVLMRPPSWWYQLWQDAHTLFLRRSCISVS